MEIDYNQALIRGLSSGSSNKLMLGKILDQLKETKEYLNEQDDSITSWAEYLKQPEINLTVLNANKLIKISKTFEEVGFDKVVGISYRKLELIEPLIENASDDLVEELLVSAKVLTQKDLKESIYDHKTEDKGERTYKYIIMRKCIETGSMNMVHGVDSDEVVDKFNINEDGYINE